MSKHLSILTFIFLVFSCKTQDKAISSNQATEVEILFILRSTSCMGECPVYEIIIKADSTIHFNGEKFTTVKGTANKKLSSEEYTKIMAMINEVAWSKLDDKYESRMLDLPTFYFVYKEKSIYQYGSEPKPLIKLRRDLLSIIDNKDFF